MLPSRGIQLAAPATTSPVFRTLNANLIFRTPTEGGYVVKFSNQKTDRDAAMRQFMMTVTALAVFAAFAGKTHAEVNYPWCLMGDTRGYECVFSSREQCNQDGRNRGFGGQCIQNPAYK